MNGFHHPATGKGDAPRPHNKWKYDQGYLRWQGQPCPTCHGTEAKPGACTTCDGMGYVEKPRGRR